jgi:8-oxo-dGTP diphosphatase
MSPLLEKLYDRPASAGGIVVCTHRPVLPWVFDAVGLENPGLETGEMVVLHLRKGRIRMAERHSSLPS